MNEYVVSSNLYQCHVTSVNGHMTRPLYFLLVPPAGNVYRKLVQEEVSKIPLVKYFVHILFTTDI